MTFNFKIMIFLLLSISWQELKGSNEFRPVHAVRLSVGGQDQVFDLQPWPNYGPKSGPTKQILKAQTSSWAVPLLALCQKLSWTCTKAEQELNVHYKNLHLKYFKNEKTVEISGLQVVLKEALVWTSSEILAPISFIDQVINSILEFPIVRIRSEATRWQESWVISSTFYNFLRWLKKPAQAGEKMNVVIDPGHGGEEKGTMTTYSGKKGKKGPLTVYEKDLTLRYAREILVLLARETNWNIFLTRSNDTSLTLYERAQQANQIPADLLISIHFNYSPSTKTRGSEIHYNAILKKSLDLDKRITPAAWSQMVDEGDLKRNQRYFEYIDHKKIEQSVKASKKLGQILANHLSKNKFIPFRQMRASDLAVLNHSYYPAVLVELGYLSNQADRNYLMSKKGMNLIVQELVSAIKDYWLKQKEGGLSVVLN